MTPLEKILRDALGNIKKELEFMEKYGCGDSGDETASNIIEIVDTARKQADEIKDGPSEEDRKWLNNLATMSHDSIFWNDIDLLISKLKQAWGWNE